MIIQRLDTDKRMAQAVIHGGMVYLAGQVALGRTIEDQTQGVLNRIDGLLNKAGTDKSRLVTATIWLADMADFAAMNSVWEEWVDAANPPARATGEVRLATPDYRIEIIVTAALAQE